MAASAYDVLSTPLSRIDLDSEVDFQQYQTRGVSLSVDPDSVARINAALGIAKDAVAGPRAIPFLVEMMGQDRSSGVAGDLVGAFAGGNATVDDGRRVTNLAGFGEADLACQVIAQDALAAIRLELTTAPPVDVPALIAVLTRTFGNHDTPPSVERDTAIWLSGDPPKSVHVAYRLPA